MYCGKEYLDFRILFMLCHDDMFCLNSICQSDICDMYCQCLGSNCWTVCWLILTSAIAMWSHTGPDWGGRELSEPCLRYNSARAQFKACLLYNEPPHTSTLLN